MSGVEPVRRHVIVEATLERTFRVFTDGMDRWWPRQHHIGSSPMKRTVLESRPGGRWFSVCEDGSECDVGEVLTWDPPNRLILAWHITAEWKYDPDFVTEVEVNFRSEGPRRTRVDLEHRDLHRYGVAAAGIRKQIDADGGWLFILQQCANACAEEER